MLTLTAGVALASMPQVAAGPDGERARLRQLREQVSAVRQQLARQRNEVAQRAGELTQVQRQLDTVADAVAATQSAVQRQHRAVDVTQREVQAQDERADERASLLQERIAAMYKRGIGREQLEAFAANSPSEFADRMAFSMIVTRADKEVIEEASAARVAAEAQRRELGREETRLAVALEEQRAIMTEVETLRQQRAVQLAESRSRLADLRLQEEHLDADSDRVLAAIQQAEARAARARSGRASRDAAPAPPVAPSGWVWPARGTVTSEFGPRWGRQHQGIDIAASTGTTLVAARAGTVLSAGPTGSYGLMTLIDHGGGIVTAYAHQNRIVVRAGQRVAAGQQIGEIGSTGRSSGPHVHFEVRVNGSPQNPRRYLP